MNNPLIYIDPSGHSWFSEAIDWFQELLGDANEVIEDVIPDNVNINGGGGGSIDSEGIEIWTGSPDTGSTYPVGRIEWSEITGGNDSYGRGYGHVEFNVIGVTAGGRYWDFGNGSDFYYEGLGGPSGKVTPEMYVDSFGVEFINSTGGTLRGCDGQGCGYFGASREGNRDHLGIDIESKSGQNVFSPFGGIAYKNSYIYGGVDVKGEFHNVRILYITPSDSIREAGSKGVHVWPGQVIGTALNIVGTIYPANITNHIHLQLYDGKNGNLINPTPFFPDALR